MEGGGCNSKEEDEGVGSDEVKPETELGVVGQSSEDKTEGGVIVLGRMEDRPRNIFSDRFGVSMVIEDGLGFRGKRKMVFIKPNIL